MTEWTKSLMEELGHVGIVFLMFLENVFPPIPSEVVMPFAGYATADGELHMWGVILAGTAGSVLGALPLYYLGRMIGRERLRRWADAHGAWLTVSGDDIDRAHDWFCRHGAKAVFWCRFVPGIRSLISVPAGVSEMPMLPFLGWTALGTGLWAAALASVGRALGNNHERVAVWLDPALYVVLGLAVIWYVVRLVRLNPLRS